MFDVSVFTSPKDNDCGATCLKMLCDYYKVDVAFDDLIKECNTSVIGCSMGDMKRAGIAHGLDMRAYRMTADEIYKIDRPAIVWWKKHHFVVYCGINDKDRVVVINPDKGRYTLDKSTFKTFYSDDAALFVGEPQDLPDEPSLDEQVADLTELVSVLSEVICSD